MSKKDKLADSLTKNLPAKPKAKTNEVTKEIQDDYEFSRKTYKDLIDSGINSIDVLAELARDSEHPRAFEVLSQSIKNISDVTEKLMKLQKNKKDLTLEETKKEEAKQITNNNVFVGSTTDLQRMLAAQDDDKVIDVDPEE